MKVNQQNECCSYCGDEQSEIVNGLCEKCTISTDDSIIKEKGLSEIEVWRVVLEWYPNGMYAPELLNYKYQELEGICEIRLGELGYYD